MLNGVKWEKYDTFESSKEKESSGNKVNSKTKLVSNSYLICRNKNRNLDHDLELNPGTFAFKPIIHVTTPILILLSPYPTTSV